MGVFARSLPLNAVCADETTFQALLAQTQRDFLEFRNWQDSFSWADAGLSAEDEHGPVLPFAFEYAELPAVETVGGLGISTIRLDSCGERFQMKLKARYSAKSLTLSFEFDSDCVDRAMV